MLSPGIQERERLLKANSGLSTTKAIIQERLLYPKTIHAAVSNAVKNASPGINEKISRKKLYGNRTQSGAGLRIPGGLAGQSGLHLRLPGVLPVID